GEIGGDAQQPRAGPVDTVSNLVAEFFHHQQLELRAMVQQPIQIEQPLVDHVFVAVALVFDDDGAIVLVKAQRIDAPAMRLAGGVLAGEEAHAEKRLHLRFDQRLQMLLHHGRTAWKFSRGTARKSEQLDIAHCLPLFFLSVHHADQTSVRGANGCDASRPLWYWPQGAFASVNNADSKSAQAT